MSAGGGYQFEMQQRQSLTMTQSLQQSIKLLQMTSLEIGAYVDAELESNPLLMPGDEGSQPQDSQATDEVPVSEEERATDAVEEWDEAALVSSSLYQDGASASYSSDYVKNGSYADPEQMPGYESTNSSEKTLQEYIAEQISMDIISPAQQMVAFHLLDMLDENGYITDDFTSLAKKLSCEESFIEDTLHLLQECEPAGVFARSLSECLMLQLKDKNHLDPAIAIVLDNLEKVAAGDIAGLKRCCEMSEEDIQEMIQEIKTLNPKPGNVFSHEVSSTMIPDILVKKDEKGQYRVRLNNEALPKVLVDREYYATVRKATKDKEEKSFLSEQYHTANWLIKALDQRAQSILKVATEVVTQQQDFFDKGIFHLKPLTRHAVADLLGLHESTVSRVTTGKYMATPLGVFELKYFFSSSLASGVGEDYSSRTVKYLIKSFIEKEESNAILSDEKIASMLKERNISIARRTVAKYRESMHIPTSAERKRQKRISS